MRLSVMACSARRKWRDRFSGWTRRVEAHEAMDFLVLFNLRSVFDAPDRVRSLQVHIYTEMDQTPWFFTQAARNAIQFHTPLRLFGSIVTAGRATEEPGHLDLKAAMTLIFCQARLYASVSSAKHRLSRKVCGTWDSVWWRISAGHRRKSLRNAKWTPSSLTPTGPTKNSRVPTIGQGRCGERQGPASNRAKSQPGNVHNIYSRCPTGFFVDRKAYTI